MIEWLLACLMVPNASSGVQPQSRSTGPERLFATTFDSPASLQDWQAPAGVSFAERDHSPGVVLQRAASVGLGSITMSARLPVERLRGRRVRVEGTVLAEDVAKPPNAWNGVKLMLHLVSPAGDRWEQRDNLFGSFPWKRVRFMVAVPADASRAELILGLEQTTGTVLFHDVSVTALSDTPVRPLPSKVPPHPRFRGAMIGRVNADDLRTLGKEWRANHVRWQLIWDGFPHSPADTADIPAYDAWLDAELTRLDMLLPVCEESGLHVLIDLHTPPGGRDQQSICRIFQDKKWQDHFLNVWEKIAARYRGRKIVWGYDLVNEPVEGDVPSGVLTWQELAEKTARRVRELDPEHAIVVEPEPWGGPAALDRLEPINVPGIVYSVHMYLPFKYTHQGIYNNPEGVAYPGDIDGQKWNKAQIRAALASVVNFQRRSGAPIYIGEFSAIRWAPGAAQYLQNCIEIFEENNWDWAYHAFREWSGWSVEHTPVRTDEQRAAQPTDRELLLRFWFKRNGSSPLRSQSRSPIRR